MKSLSKVFVSALLCFHLMAGFSVGVGAAGYEDYVPSGKPDNMISVPAWDYGYGHVTGTSDPFVTTSYSRTAPASMTVTTDATTTEAEIYSWENPHGFKVDEWRYKPADGTKHYFDGNYVFSARVKVGPESQQNSVTFGAKVLNSSSSLVSRTITSSTDWTDFKAVFSGCASGTNEYSMKFGITSEMKGTKSEIVVDLSSTAVAPYLAKEEIYDITNTLTHEGETIESNDTLDFEAKLLNQIGLKYSGDQGDFDWVVLDEARGKELSASDGFSVTPNKEKAKLALTNVKPGNYVMFVRSKSNSKFQKGTSFKVVPPVIKDNPTKDGVTLSVVTDPTDASKTIGLFDTLNLEAQLTGEGAESDVAFRWSVLAENRLSELTDSGIVITEDETDSGKVSVELAADKAVSGTYHIAVTPVGDKYSGMLNSVTVTVDLSSAVADIQNGLKGSAEGIKAKIAKYTEYLKINEFAVIQKADADRWIALIIKNRANYDLSEETKIVDFLKKTAVLSVYQSSDTLEKLVEAGVCEANGRFTDEAAAILGLEDLDTAGITLYSLFIGSDEEEALISDEDKKSVQEALLAQNAETTKDFTAGLKESILLGIVENPNFMGNGYLNELFTEENLKAVGIDDVTDYLNLSDKTEVHGRVARKAFTIETLKAELKKKPAEEPNEDNGKKTENTKSNRGGGGGSFGHVSSETNENEDLVAALMLPFGDVSSKHWAYDDIYHLYARGIFSGRDGEHFSPEDTVTREELVKLAAVAFQLEDTGADICFRDIADDAWYRPYIRIAFGNGMINGISEDVFGVGTAITRQDICVLLVRALGVDASADSQKMTFEDETSISDYAKASVNYLSSMGVINGFEDGSFRPNASCTRAQAAKILCKVLRIGGILIEE